MKNLSEIRDSIKSIAPLENRLSSLNKRLYEAEARVAALLAQYKKESLDLEQIQKESFSSFVLKAVGRYEQRLEKESREEIEAKMSYDKAVADLYEITRQKDELCQRLYELRGLAHEYEKELAARRSDYRQRLPEADARLYEQCEAEIDTLISQFVEIDEALRAVKYAKDTAEIAADALKSADGWATYDIWAKGGIISHAAKYSHIDKAEACFNRLSSQLGSLRKELSDVRGLSVSGLTQISSTQRTFDFWFDNIFTDISVRSQIRDNIERLNRLRGSLNSVETALNSKSRETNTRLEELRRKQEDLLM